MHSKSDSSLKFEQRLPELEKKVEAMPKRAWIEKDQKWTHEMIHLKMNLLDRISSISIGSSDVQPSESPYLPVLFIGTSQSRQHDKSESVSYYLTD
ncbi:hypothetical protein Tco_0429494 [Tanacetum coccineum]